MVYSQTLVLYLSLALPDKNPKVGESQGQETTFQLLYNLTLFVLLVTKYNTQGD